MSRFLEICPQCEEQILSRVEVPQDVTVAGTVVRIPNVQVEQCRHCGFRTLSGREVGLFDVLFAPQYETVADLIEAIRTAGFVGAFLREDRSESALAFGARSYVASLADDLRNLYLDNESSHVIDGLSLVDRGEVAVDLSTRQCTVRLPKIGEGENGVVYDYAEADNSVLKLAKPRAYSREHLVQEYEVTEFFDQHGVPVPKVLESDPHGSFLIKERLAGESLSRLYQTLGTPETPRYNAVRTAVERFIGELLEMFVQHPEAKTSLSPNNIFVVLDGSQARCLLVDTGPAPFHDYSGFDFAEYWDVTIPRKIEQYRAVGYL